MGQKDAVDEALVFAIQLTEGRPIAVLRSTDQYGLRRALLSSQKHLLFQTIAKMLFVGGRRVSRPPQPGSADGRRSSAKSIALNHSLRLIALRWHSSCTQDCSRQ